MRILLNILVKIVLLATAILFSLFSFLWIEHGLVSMLVTGHPSFKSLYSVIEFSTRYRESLAIVYLVLLGSFFFLQIILISSKLWKLISKKSLFLLAGITTLVLSLGYPFLSNDFFGYLFAEKIILDYHLNPYLVAPEKFMNKELWFGFLRNIESPYAYGPMSLLYYLIPMLIFTTKKFLLDFFGIKILNAVIFYLTGILIYKLTKKDDRIFSCWFFNPFLTVELLINAHNDLLMIGLFVCSLFCLFNKRTFSALGLLAASILTKYGSFFAIPLFFLNEHKRLYLFRFVSLCLPIILQLQTIRPTLPWYYTWVYMFLPFAGLRKESWVIIDLMGMLLLVGYYPFIKYGGWLGAPLIPNTQLMFNLLLVSVVLIELSLTSKSPLRRVLRQIFVVRIKE